MKPKVPPLKGNNGFKKCPPCGTKWMNRDDFLGDPDIEMIGYQADFEELTAGLFLFNHICRGTLAVNAGIFQDLYDGPILEERIEGTEACLGYCEHEDELRPCPNQCECAYVREIIQVIRHWPKKTN